jgi:uncharacterized protein
VSEVKLFRTSDAPDMQHMPEHVTYGKPETRYRIHGTGEGGRLSTGEWSATVGAWRVNYTEWEFCHIISGRGRLRADDGRVIDIGPGDSFTINAGFTGVWEVIEPITKHFVTLDPPRD